MWPGSSDHLLKAWLFGSLWVIALIAVAIIPTMFINYVLRDHTTASRLLPYGLMAYYVFGPVVASNIAIKVHRSERLIAPIMFGGYFVAPVAYWFAAVGFIRMIG